MIRDLEIMEESNAMAAAQPDAAKVESEDDEDYSHEKLRTAPKRKINS